MTAIIVMQTMTLLAMSNDARKKILIIVVAVFLSAYFICLWGIIITGKQRNALYPQILSSGNIYILTVSPDYSYGEIPRQLSDGLTKITQSRTDLEIVNVVAIEQGNSESYASFLVIAKEKE